MSDLDIRVLTEDYAVSPQIAPEDMAAIRDLGYTTVICNRPDLENPPAYHTAVMAAAAEAAGLSFVENPFAAGLDLGIIDRQRAAIDAATGPVLAYLPLGHALGHRLGAGRGRAPPDRRDPRCDGVRGLRARRASSADRRSGTAQGLRLRPPDALSPRAPRISGSPRGAAIFGCAAGPDRIGRTAFHPST